METHSKKEKYLKAKKRVDEIRGFFIHLLVYVVVNTALSTAKVIFNLNSGETFNDAFFDFTTFAVWMAWGIGIAFHGFAVFTESTSFFRNWKERKLQKYMAQEEESFRRTNSQIKIEGYEGDFSNREAYFQAKKRLELLMGFYWHTLVYIVVNIFILAVLFFVTNISFTAWYTYATAFFWGIGLGFHAMATFGKDVVFGKNWEQRKIEAYMRQDQQDSHWN